jgi:hypothetical protein
VHSGAGQEQPQGIVDVHQSCARGAAAGFGPPPPRGLKLPPTRTVTAEPLRQAPALPRPSSAVCADAFHSNREFCLFGCHLRRVQGVRLASPATWLGCSCRPTSSVTSSRCAARPLRRQLVPNRRSQVAQPLVNAFSQRVEALSCAFWPKRWRSCSSTSALRRYVKTGIDLPFSLPHSSEK